MIHFSSQSIYRESAAMNHPAANLYLRSVLLLVVLMTILEFASAWSTWSDPKYPINNIYNKNERRRSMREYRDNPVKPVDSGKSIFNLRFIFTLIIRKNLLVLTNE